MRETDEGTYCIVASSVKWQRKAEKKKDEELDGREEC